MLCEIHQDNLKRNIKLDVGLDDVPDVQQNHEFMSFPNKITVGKKINNITSGPNSALYHNYETDVQQDIGSQNLEDRG